MWLPAASGVACVLIAAAACGAAASQSPNTAGVLSSVDHLVYGTPDVSRGVDSLEKLIGVRAAAGGQHPGEGTRNALISLGPNMYLEILGPDPEQPKPNKPRWLSIDDVKTPRLVGWAAAGTNLAQLRQAAVTIGVPIGEVLSGSRRTPQGAILTWQVTDQRAWLADGLVPFFIDWGNTPHPSLTAPKGASLIGLRAEHPDPDSVRLMLKQLRLELPVTKGPRAELISTIRGPRGVVELR